MKALLVLFFVFGMVAEVVFAQYVTPTPAPPAAPAAKDDRTPVEHGSRPDPGAVRPGNEAGDHPSAAAGELVRRDTPRRVFGLPVSTALVLAGAVIGLLVLAGIVIPGARRRREAQGGGTYGPRD
jgi:hypothetical protein